MNSIPCSFAAPIKVISCSGTQLRTDTHSYCAYTINSSLSPRNLGIVHYPVCKTVDPNAVLYSYLLPPQSRALSRTFYACSHLWEHKGMYSVPTSAACQISQCAKSVKITNFTHPWKRFLFYSYVFKINNTVRHTFWTTLSSAPLSMVDRKSLH